MPFVFVRKLQMYCEICGTGQRLLSINGIGRDLQRSPTIFDSPLAPHFEILAYDQRGLGQTSKPDIRYTTADYAADADSLLNAVGWESADRDGISPPDNLQAIYKQIPGSYLEFLRAVIAFLTKIPKHSSALLPSGKINLSNFT
ncbi:alpha/beta fold hydrolase [uncultured Nostoc sp.]|uniref:alpha/beta fold hydrolase n=1 Tax=uncultured Nostoc sp. TaxID=340711 RepID=UPI0035C95C72